MVTKLAGLALVGLGGWYLLARQGGSQPQSQRAFGWIGYPASPEEIDRQNETLGGPLDLSFMDKLFPTGPVSDTSADQGGSVFDLINGTGSVWDMTKPRGIRNNNPGNIEDQGANWRGLDEPRNDGRFLRFVDPVYGIRAMARILETYNDKHGLDYVGGIVQRWSATDQATYAAFVADQLGVRATDRIDVMERRPELIKAMIRYENGEQPYPDSLIEQGVALA